MHGLIPDDGLNSDQSRGFVMMSPSPPPGGVRVTKAFAQVLKSR